MTVVLLLLSWLAMFGIFYELSVKDRIRWSKRDSFLMASVAWGSTLVLITEALSLPRLLQRGWLLAAWLLVVLVGAGIYTFLHWRRRGPYLPLRNFRPFREHEGHQSPLVFGMLALIVFQVVTLAMSAYQFAPNNWDSMVYHMARVMHWQQNRSVAHYATSVNQQLQLTPFAEFVITHLQILTSGDRFANLVQWFAMVICAVGVSDIARKLGADKTQQIAASLLSVSIPIGILQATSTQNDYVVAAWLVCFVSLGLSLIANPEQRLWSAGAGLALGLAILTKGTAFVYAPAFCLWFGVALLRKYRWQALRFGLLIGLLVALLNVGHFTRNVRLYGSLTGPHEGYSNEIFSASVLGSNIIRNTALHLHLRTGFSVVDAVSRYSLSWLRLLHQFLGLSHTDPRTSFGTDDVFLSTYLDSFDEDYQGNPFHAVLIILTLIAIVPLYARKRITRHALIYAVVLFLAFCTFSFYVRWQIWGSRLQLSLFVLWCPVIVVALFQFARRYIYLVPIIIALISINSTFNTRTRPINTLAQYATETRAEGHFTKRPDHFPWFEAMTNAISASGCERVGLLLGAYDWEYPFWTMLYARNFRGEIRHIEVANQSQVYERSDFQPCAIIHGGSAGRDNPYAERFINQSFGGYALFIEPKMAVRLTSVPPGFSASNGLKILLGSNWYEVEADTNARWMRTPGRIWLYAEQNTGVQLALKPHSMNVGNAFGDSGQLTVMLNNTPADTFGVQVGSQSRALLQLKQGWNSVDLELAAGNFVPSESDPRALSIAFAAIDITTAAPLTSTPVGFTASSGLGVALDSGWYEVEADTNTRWMRTPGRIWLHTTQATTAKLVLKPHSMNVDNAFGDSGQLNITLNGSLADTAAVTTGRVSEVPLQLTPGWNTVQLELAAGNFTPYGGDARSLSIAFTPIQIASITEPLRAPEGFVTTPDLQVALGSGWYNFEPATNARWMQTPGNIRVYAQHGASTMLALKPHSMNVNNSFGDTGQLTVKLNERLVDTLAVKTGTVSEAPLQLAPGWNTVQLELAAGSFIPYEGDNRLLSIAFAPIELKPVSKPLDAPAGFTASPELDVLLGSGWYEREAGSNARWMQTPGRFWLYAQKAGIAKLGLKPHSMNVNNSFGDTGQLTVKLNGAATDMIGVQVGATSEALLQLGQGWNRVDLELAAGNFIPYSGDNRLLSIAFASIEIVSVPQPVQVPAGFTTAPGLDIVLGSGWYEVEPATNTRWMRTPGRIWLHTTQATTAKLVLKPHSMNVDNAFGDSGQLNITLNGSLADTAAVTTGRVSEVPLQLTPGWNTVQLELAAGNFTPYGGDARSLSIAFSPIQVNTVQQP